MKKLFEITLATLLFSIVMLISLNVYKSTNDFDPPYNTRLMIQVLDLLVKLMFMVSAGMILFFVLKMTNDYIKNYEAPADRVKMFHSEAEISFTEVERDDEGSEIRRRQHRLSFFHNITRDANDPNLHHVVQVWHQWRHNNDCNDKTSVQDFCDFVNVHTMYNAAPTKEEFYQLLKGKS